MEIDGSFFYLLELVKLGTKSTVSFSEVAISDESKIDKNGVVSVGGAEMENWSQSQVVPDDIVITATVGMTRNFMEFKRWNVW